MSKKDMLIIENLASFEKLINKDSRPYDLNMMVMEIPPRFSFFQVILFFMFAINANSEFRVLNFIQLKNPG